MRARVYGLINAGAWAAVPLGALGGGFAVEQLGLTRTLVALGVAYVLVTLTPLLGGPWRELDERRTQTPPGPPTRRGRLLLDRR